MRDPKKLPCNPIDPFNANAVCQAAANAIAKWAGHSYDGSQEDPRVRRMALQAVAQAVWTDGPTEKGDARTVAWEAELQEHLEALLCTLDRFNDL